VNVANIFDWSKARWHGAGWAVRAWCQTAERLKDSLGTRWQRGTARLRNQRRNFRYELAVCSVFQNEALFLEEWLTLHHGVGVEKFYLYNDGSSDNFMDVLQPWIERGLVKLIDNPQGWKQLQAYDNCIKTFRMQCRWIAFIDLDEFLFSPVTRDLRPVLRNYPDAAAIFVYWQMFGSNSHKTRPRGSVIKNYTRCISVEDMRRNRDPVWRVKNHFVTQTTAGLINGKSIVNPRLVSACGIHRPRKILIGDCVDELGGSVHGRGGHATRFSFARLRINHYWSKSQEDLKKKVQRHSLWFERNQMALPQGAPPIGSYARSETDLDEWLKIETILNSCVDTALLEVWEELTAHCHSAESPVQRAVQTETGTQILKTEMRVGR
jgi:hypothetical protein